MQTYRRLLQQIDNTVASIDIRQADPFLTAQVAQYLCVRLSGTIELAVRENITRAIATSSHPRAINFISKQLADFQNPRPQKIVELLGSFDKAWRAQLETFWEPEIKDAIGSIVGQRNVIAHGGSTSISIVGVRDWLKSTKSFCVFLGSIR